MGICIFSVLECGWGPYSSQPRQLSSLGLPPMKWQACYDFTGRKAQPSAVEVCMMGLT